MSASMRRFSEVIDELALRDLPCRGEPFTWSEGLNGQSLSRLDWFLVSEDWETHFSREKRFKEMLKGWWQGFNFSGSNSFILIEKLKALKTNLKIWNKDVFGKVGVNKGLALDKVFFWDDQERLRVLSALKLEAKRKLGSSSRSGRLWKKFPGDKNQEKCG
ncbi:hypothetical protein CK203_026064 [Vitis vinifera]|uniref:Reverse transcriptase zinc-binding domain-containing protein n=1 Tax=Vitis vinifera TaxID=29760 RepID=A0A438IJ54_VITVI|nr:hypothetical protein CK203_026064 [Vitis vinifera]